MSANTKVAATFHGADLAQVRIDDLAVDRAARIDRQREQALRAHIAGLLADVDHFHTCADPNNCTCLLGRIRWAVAADELPKPDQTTAAIDTLARHIIGLRMWQDDFGAQAWQEIPEVAAHDFAAISDRVKAIIADTDPSTADYDNAYTHLRSRVDGAA